MVGDDVVQLAGDALALFEQRALALVAPLDDRELLAAAAPGADDDARRSTGTAARKMAVTAVGGSMIGGAEHRHHGPWSTTTHASQRTATAYRHRT